MNFSSANASRSLYTVGKGISSDLARFEAVAACGFRHIASTISMILLGDVRFAFIVMVPFSAVPLVPCSLCRSVDIGRCAEQSHGRCASVQSVHRSVRMHPRPAPPVEPLAGVGPPGTDRNPAIHLFTDHQVRPGHAVLGVEQVTASPQGLAAGAAIPWRLSRVSQPAGAAHAVPDRSYGMKCEVQNEKFFLALVDMHGSGSLR